MLLIIAVICHDGMRNDMLNRKNGTRIPGSSRCNLYFTTSRCLMILIAVNKRVLRHCLFDFFLLWVIK